MRLPQELLALIFNGESLEVEFKKSTTEITKDVYDTVCFFSNRNGGHIFLGVKDNGTILGIQPDCVDAMKKNFVTSVNNENKMYPRGADPRRARFHSAVLDSTMLKPKQGFKEMADSVVIFITEKDYFGDGKPIRSYTRRCDQEPTESLGDGNRIIYVNGAYENDDEPIGRLMHDFRCASAVDMFYSELADKVRELKETKGGQDRMCKLMEDMRNEAAAEAWLEQTKKTAFKMKKKGYPDTAIADILEVGVTTLQKWFSETPSVAR